MIVAVDPGLHGAIACYDPASGLLQIVAMPTYEASGAKTKRRYLDEAALLEHLHTLNLFGDVTLIIEHVGGIPGQSAPAAFTFGYGVGVVLTAARMLKWRIERVASQVWKSALRVPRDKQAARARASELLPQASQLWPLKGDDGKAEAAMLALYAERILGAS